MMPTPTISKRAKTARHKAGDNHAALRTADAPSRNDEIQQLRDQIMHLRSTVTEQERSIEFLRDLLSQRWFDAE